jgi:hypothetical protein
VFTLKTFTKGPLAFAGGRTVALADYAETDPLCRQRWRRRRRHRRRTALRRPMRSAKRFSKNPV